MAHMKWQHKAVLLALSLFSLAILCAHFTDAFAANPKKKLSLIERQIQKKKSRVKEAIKKESSILSIIQDIDKSIDKKKKEFNAYSKRIKKVKAETNILSKDITSLDKKLAKRKNYLKDRLRSLYKQRYGGAALVLVSAKDYSDLIRKSRYISLIAYQDEKIMNAYSREMENLGNKKTSMATLQETLETNKRNSLKKKQEMQHDRRKKERLLSTIRSKRSSYEKAVEELEKSSKELRDMIKKLNRRRLPKSVTGSGFRSWKRRLPWPVKGKIVVPYGKYKDPKFKITVFKNGIEIKPREGYSPQAVIAGRVVYADWFKGYGKILILDHGSGYHTLYGHMSEIFHSTGDIIKKGTTLGKVGKSEMLNITTLYFEIRYRGKPVDPMKWLTRNRRR
jgi:septal ring factor EnvC (AmiA/AmiB activator)